MWVLSGGQGRRRAFSAPRRGCELQMICCLPEDKEEKEGEEEGERKGRGRGEEGEEEGERRGEKEKGGVEIGEEEK